MTADSMAHDQTHRDQERQHGASQPRTPEVVRASYQRLMAIVRANRERKERVK